MNKKIKGENTSRIYHQILTDDLLHGCIYGCVAAILVLAVGIASDSWPKDRGSIIALALVLFAFFLLYAVISATRKYRKLLFQISLQEEEYGGDFDATPLAEIGESGTFFVNQDFLVWHEDSRYLVWNRGDILRIDNSGREPRPGNRRAMVRITDRRKAEQVLIYDCSENHSFLHELVAWVSPAKAAKAEAQPEKKICSACGAPNAPEATHCAWCGTPFQEFGTAEKDIHHVSPEEQGFVPMESPAPVVSEQPARGTKPVYQNAVPAGSARTRTSFWIALAAVVAAALLLLFVALHSGQPRFWGDYTIWWN
jgi:ribosomal protein L40E